jgi:hypothetical protein
MEEAEEWMRFGSSAQFLQQGLTLVGEDIGAGLARALALHQAALPEKHEVFLNRARRNLRVGGILARCHLYPAGYAPQQVSNPCRSLAFYPELYPELYPERFR